MPEVNKALYIWTRGPLVNGSEEWTPGAVSCQLLAVPTGLCRPSAPGSHVWHIEFPGSCVPGRPCFRGENRPKAWRRPAPRPEPRAPDGELGALCRCASQGGVVSQTP